MSYTPLFGILIMTAAFLSLPLYLVLWLRIIRVRIAAIIK